MINKLASIFIISLVLNGCTSSVNQNRVLDYDWEFDIYNVVVSNVKDIDNIKYWVRRKPEYSNGSPFFQACVEVSQPNELNSYYLANLSTYTLKEVRGCEKDFLNHDNLVNNTSSDKKRFDNLQNHDGIETIWKHNTNNGLEKHLYLKFSNLFFVNESVLTSQGKSTLDYAISQLEKVEIEEIFVYGIADSSGSYQKNKILARNRSDTVKQYMMEEGLRGTRIETRGTVENALNTREERVQQRRFVIEVKLK